MSDAFQPSALAPSPNPPPPPPQQQPQGGAAPPAASPLAQPSPFAQSPVPQPYQDESAAYARKAEADRKAWEDREAAWKPIADKLRRELTAGNPPPPEEAFRKLPAPPSINPQQYAQNALGFVGVMAVLGALSSRFTRNAGNASLNAFAGAVKGWQQGNLDAYNQKSKEWEATTKQMLENNKMVLDKYKAILANKSLNIEQQMAAAKLVAAEYQDKIAFDALDAGNYTMFAQLYDKQTTAQDKAVASFLQLSGDKFHETEQNQAKARQLETPEGQAWMQGLDPANRMKLEGFLKVYGSGAPSLALTSGPALDADAERYRQTGTLPPNMGRGIQGQQQATQIRERATELEIAQGGDPTQWPLRWQEFKARGAGLSREQGAIGQRAGAIAVSVDEADRTIPIVRKLAERSAGKGVATWNAIENKWQVESGDRNFQEYVTQLNSLVNIYGRVISGGGKGTVSDLEHARELANPNMPVSGVEGSLDAMAREIEIAKTAPERVRDVIRQQQEAAHRRQTPEASPSNNGGIIKYDAQGNRIE